MNSITFQSSTGIPSDVTIAYSALTDQSNYTIKLDGADYIYINNMTIKADGPIYAYASY
jgi:ribose 5-phosphate isomerase